MLTYLMSAWGYSLRKPGTRLFIQCSRLGANPHRVRVVAASAGGASSSHAPAPAPNATVAAAAAPVWRRKARRSILLRNDVSCSTVLLLPYIASPCHARWGRRERDALIVSPQMVEGPLSSRPLLL